MLILIWLLWTFEQLVANPPLPPNQLPVIVVPQILSFGSQNIGYVAQKNFTIYNNADMDISIATDYDERDHFHPLLSRGEKLRLPRNGKQEITIHFLPRTVGDVRSIFKIYIYTISNMVPSDIVDVNLLGVGTENPYQIRPYIGVKWPTNIAFTPTITMYNPHRHVLRVKEMYSSGGGLHLDLPNDISKDHTWDLLPFESKDIMKINFQSKVAYNHLSYITIKTDEVSQPDIKLPVEINLVDGAGVFSRPSMIDFGHFAHSGPPKVIDIFLLSTYNCSLRIFSINIQDSILHQNGISVKLVKDELFRSQQGMFQKVAEITITPSLLPDLLPNLHNKHVGNVSIVFTNKNNINPKLKIPFMAHVFHGSLNAGGIDPGFYSGALPSSRKVRNFTLENSYNVPLAIREVVFSQSLLNIFNINKLALPVIIYPDVSAKVCELSLKEHGPRYSKKGDVTIKTNLTDFPYQINIYDGAVDVFIDGKPQNVLNFELLGYNQTRYKIVTLKNNNPVPVQLLYYFTNVPFAEGYYTRLYRHGEGFSNISKDDVMQHKMVVLASNDFMEINVTISTPSVAHNVSGFFVVETNYDFVQLPLTFRTLEGELFSLVLNYKDLFPGKSRHLKLVIRNTFNETIPVSSIQLEKSSMVSIVELKRNIKLKPLSNTEVSVVSFNPTQVPEYSYLLTDDVKKQKEWFKGTHLNFEQVDYELKLYKHLQGKWSHLNKLKKNKIVVDGVIQSSFADNTKISLNLEMIWPSLVEKFSHFQVTHVKDTTTSVVQIANPSSHPLHIEAFFINHHPHARALADILGLKLDVVNIDNTFSFEHDNSNLIDIFLNSNDISDKIETIILKPYEKRNFSFNFSPHFVGLHKNVLVLRNNLTLFEPMLFTATAAQGDLKFHRKSELVFSIHENILRMCKDLDENSMEAESFAINRTFTLKNNGDIAVNIEDILINGVSCSAYGISVFNCNQHLMEPNSTYQINMNFIPNFHYSHVEYTLTVKQKVGKSLQIPLIAKLPPHMLSVCSDKIVRPLWEAPLRFLSASFLICLIITIFVQSYMFFRYQPLMFNTNINPIVIHKPLDLQAPSPPKALPINKKQAKKVAAKQNEPLKLTKKKSKELYKQEAKAKDVKILQNVAETLKPKELAKVVKKKVVNKVSSKVVSKPIVLETVVKTPKPAKMTSIVKPQIKEQPELILEPIKKIKDNVNIVKPARKKEPDEPTANPISPSKYKLSNKLAASIPDPKLSQEFAKAVQEQKKKMQAHNPFLGSYTSWQPKEHIISPIMPLKHPKPSISPIGRPNVMTPIPNTPLRSPVDDWFAPNATQDMNFPLWSGERQTSRLQSMFPSTNTPPSFSPLFVDKDIWAPINDDEGEKSWNELE